MIKHCRGLDTCRMDCHDGRGNKIYASRAGKPCSISYMLSQAAAGETSSLFQGNLEGGLLLQSLTAHCHTGDLQTVVLTSKTTGTDWVSCGILRCGWIREVCLPACLPLWLAVLPKYQLISRELRDADSGFLGGFYQHRGGRLVDTFHELLQRDIKKFKVSRRNCKS